MRYTLQQKYNAEICQRVRENKKLAFNGNKNKYNQAQY